MRCSRAASFSFSIQSFCPPKPDNSSLNSKNRRETGCRRGRPQAFIRPADQNYSQLERPSGQRGERGQPTRKRAVSRRRDARKSGVSSAGFRVIGTRSRVTSATHVRAGPFFSRPASTRRREEGGRPFGPVSPRQRAGPSPGEKRRLSIPALPDRVQTKTSGPANVNAARRPARTR